MTRTIILIGIGGAVGSIFRYLTSVVVNKYIQAIFPFATFFANVLGCFLIGLLLGLFDRQQFGNSDLKFLLVTGFCGGYTTFSTFSAENISLLQSGNSTTAFLYMVASLAAGLLAVWVGVSIIK